MICPNCESGDDYDLIGNHWRQSCSYPEPSENQIEVIDGLMMGDASLSRTSENGNPSVDIVSTNNGYLKWLNDYLGPLSVGVKVKRTPSESSDEARRSDVVPSDGEYRMIYRLRLRRLPAFERYEEWYSDSGKAFPEDLQLTPKRVKHWYVCDGGLSWNKDTKSARSQICSSNESDRLSEFVEFFEQNGIESTAYDDRIQMNRAGTVEFLKWIGNPVPAFEYKWNHQSLEAYEQAMSDAYNA